MNVNDIYIIYILENKKKEFLIENAIKNINLIKNNELKSYLELVSFPELINVSFFTRERILKNMYKYLLIEDDDEKEHKIFIFDFTENPIDDNANSFLEINPFLDFIFKNKEGILKQKRKVEDSIDKYDIPREKFYSNIRSEILEKYCNYNYFLKTAPEEIIQKMVIVGETKTINLFKKLLVNRSMVYLETDFSSTVSDLIKKHDILFKSF